MMNDELKAAGFLLSFIIHHSSFIIFMTTVGVIGCGYWGPNLIRNFVENERASLRWICDVDAHRLREFGRRYPFARTTTDHRQMLADAELDAVVVATPVATHYPFVKDALTAGKHVLVEKPFTTSMREAEELLRLAEGGGGAFMG